MRSLLVVALTCMLAVRGARAARYEGVVVRASDSRPIAGIVVHAFLTPPWYTMFVGPMGDVRLGRCTTNNRGEFHFELPYSSSRLLFTVGSSTITRRRLDGSTTAMIFAGGAELRHPKSKRLNVLRIPDGPLPAGARIVRRTKA